MNVEDLYHLMEKSSPMSVETLLDLRKIVNDYPTFQVAKILYLRNLAELNEKDFTSELERLIVSLPDRKKVFQLIEGEKYQLDIQTQMNEHSQTDDSFSLVDAFLSDKEHETISTDNTVLFQPSASSDYMFWSLSESGKTEEEEHKQDRQLLHQDLIDSFIEKDQQRVPGRGLDMQEVSPEAEIPESVRNLDEENANSLEDSCLTETLARIYIKQKRYNKALQIIKNLSLKYPEKNVYFADQIRFLEKLIINTKK